MQTQLFASAPDLQSFSGPLQMFQVSRPTPPAAGVGLALAALALGGFAIGTTEFATMSLLPAFSHGLGVNVPTGSYAISAYALGVVVGAPLLAVAGARISRRTMLMLLMSAFMLGNLLSALAPSFPLLIAFRFVSGLPHGAYFGIAALVAASLVAPERRTTAVGRVMLGLTVATIIGVPAANALGQVFGWRWGFAVVAAIALVSAALVWTVLPHDPARADASFLGELGALHRPQVWLTLGIGAIGFGGLFAIYTYLASTLMAVTHAQAYAVPLVLSVFGVGMTLGNIIVPRFADRALMPTAGALLVWMAGSAALYPLAAHRLWSITLAAGALGLGGALATVLQTRLMDVAGHAQALAAALNHSAFNTANALGPWLGAMAISAGYGWTSTGWVACGLAGGGLIIWSLALVLGPRPGRRSHLAQPGLADGLKG